MDGTNIVEKIAILILAHNKFSQLSKLIEQFDVNLFDIYIHVDLKTKVNPAFKDFILKKRNVVLLQDEARVKTFWGGFSMIEAELRLLRTARQKKHLFYILISGQDLLIKKSRDLFNFLSSNKAFNFNSYSSEGEDGRFLKRFEVYWPSFLRSPRNCSRYARAVYMIITGGRAHTFSFLKRNFSTEYNFIYGSQWFAYNSETVDYIFHFLDENPRFIKEFRTVLIPDESFFLTIIGTSKDILSSVKPGLTKIEWLKGLRHPKVFRSDDFLELEKSTCFFARKFDETVDSEIIDKIIALSAN